MRSIILVILMVLLSTNGFASDKVTVLVEGMTCPMCGGKVESAFKENPEVEEVAIDIGKGTVQITIKNGKKLSDDMIRSAVFKAGYEAKEIKR